jgi:hypothetical protein
MIASSTSYLPPADKGSKNLSVKMVQKPAPKITPSVSVEERVQRIEQERTMEAVGAQNNPAGLSQASPQDRARTTIDANPRNQAIDQNAMEVQTIERTDNERPAEASSQNNPVLSAQQQSPQVNTTTTIITPDNCETKGGVVMTKAEEDNDGFDVVGSVFKVYPKPKSQQGNIWSDMILS